MAHARYGKNLVHQPDVDHRELKLLRNVKNELTVSRDKNLILRCTRIVIPKSLRADTIRLAHVRHQGILKTKSSMREKVWFPLNDSLSNLELTLVYHAKPQDIQKHHNLYECAQYPKETLPTFRPITQRRNTVLLTDGASIR